MMVDSTAVRVGATSDASDANVAQSAAASSVVDVAEGDSVATTCAAKCSKCDEQHSYEKRHRTRGNQRWMKLRTTVQLSGAISSTIQKSKPQLKREDSFLKRFSTRQIPEMQETLDTGDDGDGSGSQGEPETLRELRRRKRRHRKKRPSTVVNPDENFYFYWLFTVTVSVLYNLWTLIVRQSFPEFQRMVELFWVTCDNLTDLIFFFDILVQFRTGYLEQGLVVYDSKKLALHYVKSRSFVLDFMALIPLQLLQHTLGTCPILRFPRFLKIYRVYNYYYMVESRTVYPNFWRVANLIHILLILAHWFGCFYYLLSEAEKFKGDWVFPNNSAGYNTLTRKYLGSLYWSTLTLTTIGDLPTPETDADRGNNTNGTTSTRRSRYKKSRMLQFRSDTGFVFTIVSYLIGVFIFATIVGQVGNVITNRNANRLEFERLLDGAKTYMRHHKVPNGMKRRVLRWYDYSWSRGRIQGGGDINTALGLLPDKLKTELALHVNLSVLKKVTIFQECQPEFLHDLVLKMRAFIFTPGDLICRKGEVAREMFIIADGILEVISDTGHVLTTMMAGDFFGEIGILNLDGLNKRTADVRSVGYSELFSLSREDVLAAMKDYPEAQEILQSLGRKRLMEARSITKAIAEQKNRAKLNAAAAHNTFLASDHRAKNTIVNRLYNDVKGLKSVLRKSRHSAKSDDSLELQPLTSIRNQSGSHLSAGGKGTLRRMQKVTSDEHWPDEETSTQEPRERRISAGLPLLSKLKTLTDNQQQQQQQQQQRQYAAPLFHHQSTSNISPVVRNNVEPSDVVASQRHVKPEPLGAGLPLLQRLLLLKQKEDADKRSVAATPTTTIDIPVATATATTIAASDAIITLADATKKQKNGRKEVVFAKKVLVAKPSPPVKERRYDVGAGAGTKRELARPWRLLRKATADQVNSDCEAVHPERNELSMARRNMLANRRCLNPRRTLSRPNSSDAAIADKGTGSRNCGIGVAGSMVGEDATTEAALRLNASACDGVRTSAAAEATSDKIEGGTYAGLGPRWPSSAVNKRPRMMDAARSCSLDTCLGRLDDSGAGDSCPMPFEPPPPPTPGYTKTPERREPKSVSKRVLLSSRRTRDILMGRASTQRRRTSSALGHFELLRRLMRASTVQGYMARRSTLKKSAACETTLNSPPACSVASTTLFFGDYGCSCSSGNDDDDDDDDDDDGDDDDNGKGDAENATLATNVARIMHSSASTNSTSSCVSMVNLVSHDDSLLGTRSYRRRLTDEEARVKEIQHQVREKDQLIRMLRWKIAELRKHHERCFQKHSSDDHYDVDSDTPEPAFMRDDSVDTVLLSPRRSSCSLTDSNREYRVDIGVIDGMRPAFGALNRRSWEDRSEEETLELRELPSSMKPRPPRLNDVRIDIDADDTSASEAADVDELYGESDGELLLARHDRNWEVRMLARELDRREHRASMLERSATRGGHSEAGAPLKAQLQSMRSLEERYCSDAAAPTSSQRSASSDDIYKPSSNVRVTPAPPPPPPPPPPSPTTLLPPPPALPATSVDRRIVAPNAFSASPTTGSRLDDCRLQSPSTPDSASAS